jgi:Protein of unknown function (DUF2800)
VSEFTRGEFTSASNAAYDLACPGRHQAQRGIAETKSADAESGRAVHEALKRGDNAGLSLDQADIADSCRDIEAKLVAQFFGPTTKVAVFRERRFWGHLTTPVIAHHSGQADVVYVAGVRAMIFDYKTLAGDTTESPSNMQLRDLACLVKGELVVVKEVAVGIIQPLVTHSPAGVLYGAADLARAEKEMWDRVVASNHPLAQRVAGEAQCKFCLAKRSCSEYATWSMQTVPLTLGSDPLVSELQRLNPYAVPMSEWTPEQRSIVASALGPAGKALDEMRDFLKEGLSQDAGFVPGWALKPGNIIETIVEAQMVFERFVAKGGKPDAFMGCVKITKTRLKESYSAASGLKGKALESAFKSLLEGAVKSSQNAPSLEKEGK